MCNWQTTPAPDVASVPQALRHFVTQFWHPRSGFGGRSVFARPKKIRKWGKIWNKTVTWTIFNNFFLVLQKRKRPAKTAPRVPKLGYRGGWAPKFSARVTLATSGANVVCRIFVVCEKKSNIHGYPIKYVNIIHYSVSKVAGVLWV